MPEITVTLDSIHNDSSTILNFRNVLHDDYTSLRDRLTLTEAEVGRATDGQWSFYFSYCVAQKRLSDYIGANSFFAKGGITAFFVIHQALLQSHKLYWQASRDVDALIEALPGE
jgi:hypothetical protein